MSTNPQAATKPLHGLNVTFLGTSSAQPSSTRNHSSLALRLDGAVWLFDCGESTQSQLQRSGVRSGMIDKIFITHTHGDHIFGLVPLLASRLNGAGGTTEAFDDPRATPKLDQKPFEIFGPLGTRAYVRNCLKYTYTLLGSPYVVHELRLPSDPLEGDMTDLPLHACELPTGRNIPQVTGIWPDIYKDHQVSVSAAPLTHSIPCVGFVINEAPIPGKMDPKLYLPDIQRTGTPRSVLSRLQQGESVELKDGTILSGPLRRPGRKLVILGDTCNPSPIAALAADADLLIHEATNSHLPGIDPNTKRDDTFEIVEARTKSRGHSTPQMAGAFAKRVGAKKLILNHFSARYAGNDDIDDGAKRVMIAIAELAAEAFEGDVICARDLMSVDVELPR